jgi:hypothetical protein
MLGRSAEGPGAGFFRQRLAASGILIDDADEIGAAIFAEQPGVELPHPAGADQPDPHFARRRFAIPFRFKRP